MMAAVTIIQLAMRDVVSADQTYLDHLGNKAFIISNECKIVDKFVMAFKNNDLDLLDEAQRGDSLFFLDPEVQPLARNLSLFSARAREAAQNAENAKITRELKQLTLAAAVSPTEIAMMASPLEAEGQEDEPTDEAEPDLC